MKFFAVLNDYVSRDLLNSYIKRKIREDCSQADNQKIYEHLRKIYSNMKNSRFTKNNNIKQKNLMMVE